jgi:hypothetical protein
MTGLSNDTYTTSTNATSTENETLGVEYLAPVRKGDDISCYGQRVGVFKNGRLYMKLDERVVSFVPPKIHGTEVDQFNLKDLTCNSSPSTTNDFVYSNFAYQGLEISTKIYGPYAVYKTVETAKDNNKITYKCDGSLTKTGETYGVYTTNEPYFDCQTNGKDVLTQYEFTAAEGHPVLTTGGDFGKFWH